MVWLFIGVYLVVGIIANQLYKKRDLFCSQCVDYWIDEILTLKFPNVTVKTSAWLFQLINRFAIDFAGWWYWRWKRPFSKLSIRTRNIIALPFWPIDILMCEIGFIRERKYLDKYYALPRQEGTGEEWSAKVIM